MSCLIQVNNLAMWYYNTEANIYGMPRVLPGFCCKGLIWQ